MENASKALIMAGAILIALVIISLGVLVVNNFGNNVKKNANFTAQEISEFNGKITPYIGNNISGSQVNALIQTVRSINQKSIEEYNEGIITITYPGGGLSTSNEFNEDGSRRVETGKYYIVKVNYNTDGLIDNITVESQPNN